MSPVGSVLVVGASAAGLATAEGLRRKGYEGALTLLGAEPELPCDRPPLSNQVLNGQWEETRAQLRSAQALDALDAAFVLGDAAISFNAERREVSTASGRVLHAVVIATGVGASLLPARREVRGTHVIRTLGDAAVLRTELLSARRVVVIGDGALGAETAATARQRGRPVTLVGPQTVPMARHLGALAAGQLAELHRRNGVRLLGGVLPDTLHTRDGRVAGVRLSDGTELEAAVVIVAIGCRPATEWLQGSGRRSPLAPRRARALAAPGKPDQRGRPGPRRRRGHPRNRRAYRPVPHFWTDQFDARLQIHGIISPDARAEIVEGDPRAGRFVVRYTGSDGPEGVLGWNMPRQTRLRRVELTGRYTLPRETADAG